MDAVYFVTSATERQIITLLLSPTTRTHSTLSAAPALAAANEAPAEGEIREPTQSR